jgi:glyceraldehyde-3-phosphate dehydrogenase (NAD(P))
VLEVKVRVGVNGYGTIGKRVAFAVAKQDDMELVGVVKKSVDIAAFQAVAQGLRLYVPGDEDVRNFESAGLKVNGTLQDLLGKVDVIVDATPGGVGQQYKPLYERFGVKQVYQGGEKPEVAEASFNSLCNYKEAIGGRSVRVVSCNTTGLLRIICAIRSYVDVESVRALIVRRAADPREVKRGPINSIELDPPKAPSHHARDVKTVIKGLNVITYAVAVPTTLAHLHHVTLRLSKSLSKQDIISILDSTPRIILLNSERTGITGTAGLIEAARDVRLRYDIPELVVFEDSVLVDDRDLMLFQAVHQESIVVPENVDAIRAITGVEVDPFKSIEKTDSSLGLTRKLW